MPPQEQIFTEELQDNMIVTQQFNPALYVCIPHNSFCLHIS